MPWCDTCNVELTGDAGSNVPHRFVVSGIEAGFRPPRIIFEKLSGKLHKPIDEIEDKWVQTFTTSENRPYWLLCDVCKDKLERILHVFPNDLF